MQMKSIRRISVVVPAFNEAATITTTLSEIRTYLSTKPYEFEVIVSADGEDGTRERVREWAGGDARFTVIGEPRRRGKGRGVREGVLLASGDVIGFVDADNKTPIGEFDKMESRLASGCPVVIGSRGLPQSSIERAQPWYRRWGSKGFAVLMHAVVGLDGIIDTQCGFKFFLRDAALDVFGRQRIDGYMFDVEILYLAKAAGYPIAQVPVRWRDDGDSRLRLLAGNARNLMDIFRIRLAASRLPVPAVAADGGLMGEAESEGMEQA